MSPSPGWAGGCRDHTSHRIVPLATARRSHPLSVLSAGPSKSDGHSARIPARVRSYGAPSVTIRKASAYAWNASLSAGAAGT